MGSNLYGWRSETKVLPEYDFSSVRWPIVLIVFDSDDESYQY